MVVIDYKNKNMAGLLSRFGNSLFFQENTVLVLIKDFGAADSRIFEESKFFCPIKILETKRKAKNSFIS
jgi:hypothetical protein